MRNNTVFKLPNCQEELIQDIINVFRILWKVKFHIDPSGSSQLLVGSGI